MLTDLHLRKYIDGLLSEEESQEVEAMLEKHPEMRERLEVLKNQSQVLGKHAWERSILGRKSRHGTRTRYGILLPGILLLVIVMLVSQHWFSKPGENSTFTLIGGTGSALELLYDSDQGWRYLDAGFKAGDSLTLSVRDPAQYHLAVFAIFGGEVVTLLSDSPEKAYGKTSSMPAFALDAKAYPNLPDKIVVVYDGAPLPELSGSRIQDLIAYQGVERGGLEFHFQVFAPHSR